jgi:hypothetical protein
LGAAGRGFGFLVWAGVSIEPDSYTRFVFLKGLLGCARCCLLKRQPGICAFYVRSLIVGACDVVQYQ